MSDDNTLAEALAFRPDLDKPPPAPSLQTTPVVLVDEETLDLSVPEPQPTAHLAFEFSGINIFKSFVARPPDFVLKEVSEPAKRLITFQRNSFDITPGNRQGCWAVEPSRTFTIKLKLEERDQLTLTYELYVPEDPGVRAYYQDGLAEADWQTPLTFRVYGGDQPTLYQTLPVNPLGREFIKVTTPPLPLTHQRVGENECQLIYTHEAIKPLLVRSVTLRRFSVQTQQQTQWCWAAVTASLLSLLKADNAAQSEVVNQTLTPDDIAQNANRPFDITEAAKKAGLLVKYTSRALPLWDVRDGINQGLPIPLQINWKREDGELGSGHYVVLTAIGPDHPDGEDATTVIVEDPSKGRLEMTWAELKGDYPGAANKHLYNRSVSGVWTFTHRIVKPPAKRVKVVKARVPKFTGLAGRQEFFRQWAQARPAGETDDQLRQAVETELRLLKEYEERLLWWRFQESMDVAAPEFLQEVEQRDARLAALQQQFIRLLWVRELLPPEALIADDSHFALRRSDAADVKKGFFADPARPKFFGFRP